MFNKIIWAIVGLGNPGKEYSLNRHNVGWQVIDALINKYSTKKKERHRTYYYALININNTPVLLAKPRTYMNRSGIAVANILKKYSLMPQNIIVVSDEYNFELGRLHLRLNGGNGGHNGIASIEDWLRTPDFYRLRCGIGKNFEEGEMVNYVLSDFDENEKPIVDDMIKKAVLSIEYIITHGIARAMSDINSGELWKN